MLGSGLMDEFDASLEVLRQILVFRIRCLNVHQMRRFVLVFVDDDIGKIDDAENAFDFILPHQITVGAILERTQVQVWQYQ